MADTTSPDTADASGSEEPMVLALKTSIGRERSVAEMLGKKAKDRKAGLYSILVPDQLRGYILVEAEDPQIVESMLVGVPHAIGVIKGAANMSEIEHFLTPVSAIVGISEGDIVELISGPFKNEKAKVKRLDETKEEITVELVDAVVPIPVTVRADSIKVISKEQDL